MTIAENIHTTCTYANVTQSYTEWQVFYSSISGYFFTKVQHLVCLPKKEVFCVKIELANISCSFCFVWSMHFVVQQTNKNPSVTGC